MMMLILRGRTLSLIARLWVQLPVEEMEKKTHFMRQSRFARWQVNEQFFFNISNFTTNCGVLSSWAIFFQKWKWLEFSLCVGKLVGSSASWRNDNAQIFKAEHLHLLVGERTFFAQCQQSYKSLWRFQLLRNFCMESEMIDFSLLVGKVWGSSAGWKKW